MPQLVLANSVGVVDLVAQHKEGSLAQVLHAEQRIELGLALGEALGVLGVDEEHNTADFGEVVLPQAAGLLVAAQVEGVEAHAADGQLFGRRVQGGLEDCDAVVLEHVEELEWGGSVGTALVCEGCLSSSSSWDAYSGLAGVVETQEEQLSVLVCKPKLGEHVPNYTIAYPSASCSRFVVPLHPSWTCASPRCRQRRGPTYTSRRSTYCSVLSLRMCLWNSFGGCFSQGAVGSSVAAAITSCYSIVL